MIVSNPYQPIDPPPIPTGTLDLENVKYDEVANTWLVELAVSDGHMRLLLGGGVPCTNAALTRVATRLELVLVGVVSTDG